MENSDTELNCDLLVYSTQLKKLLSHANNERNALRYALARLVDECMASDFNEHWGSYKEAVNILRSIPNTP